MLVGLGSYLVNAGGGCNDCHTHPSFAPGGNPFQGETEIINTAQFLAGGRQFGPITSANITPDENGRPAGLTFEEFEHLMRTGEDDGEILQVMPWNVYGKLTRLDLRAIYEGLLRRNSRRCRTIPRRVRDRPGPNYSGSTPLAGTHYLPELTAPERRRRFPAAQRVQRAGQPTLHRSGRDRFQM